ncbi:MAG: hypothetical protein IT371_10000 [Deltaproteobacteria bacterium]|nr:hypothetical protein [Deltaproteobacteria bacterium]
MNPLNLLKSKSVPADAPPAPAPAEPSVVAEARALLEKAQAQAKKAEAELEKATTARDATAKKLAELEALAEPTPATLAEEAKTKRLLARQRDVADSHIQALEGLHAEVAEAEAELLEVRREVREDELRAEGAAIEAFIVESDKTARERLRAHQEAIRAARSEGLAGAHFRTAVSHRNPEASDLLQDVTWFHREKERAPKPVHSNAAEAAAAISEA